jgi:hypothetical protein
MPDDGRWQRLNPGGAAVGKAFPMPSKQDSDARPSLRPAIRCKSFGGCPNLLEQHACEFMATTCLELANVIHKHPIQV